MPAKAELPIDDLSVAEFATELASTADEYTNSLRPNSQPDGDDLASSAGNPSAGFGAVMRIPLNLKVIVGSATMSMADLAKLQKGALIALDRRVGDTADIVVNGHPFAKGEIVIVDEKTSRFGILLTEIGAVPGNLAERKRE